MTYHFQVSVSISTCATLQQGILWEIISSTRSILFTSWLNLLLMFIPITFIAQAGGAGDGRACHILLLLATS